MRAVRRGSKWRRGVEHENTGESGNTFRVVRYLFPAYGERLEETCNHAIAQLDVLRQLKALDPHRIAQELDASNA